VAIAKDRGEGGRERRGHHPDEHQEPDARGSALLEGEDGQRDRHPPVGEIGLGERQLEAAQAGVVENLAQGAE
jgi:hypothetical protein